MVQLLLLFFFGLYSLAQVNNYFQDELFGENCSKAMMMVMTISATTVNRERVAHYPITFLLRA